MFSSKRHLLGLFPILILASLIAASPAQEPAKHLRDSTASRPKPKLGDAPAVLWREPTDIKTRNLFYGPGGQEHAPKGKLDFIKEKMNGVNPKFDVRDEDGVRWGVKFGKEAKPETAATRLVWAVGYFTNEDYYIAKLPVGNLGQKMTRGQSLIVDGKIQGARLKRHNKGEHEVADWSWDSNPFVGTKELDGLKVMMEIICNTDLKKLNQHVYDVNGEEQRYVAADLGASFGKAGKTIFRSKGDLKDYQSLPLIKTAGPDFIDFWHFKHIPREHAKWIGGYLAQLSDEQISDAFRASGFTPEEVDGFTKKVRDKINELTSL